MIADVIVFKVPIKDPNNLQFTLELPLGAIFRRVDFGLARSKLQIGNEAFPLLRLCFQADSTLTLTEKRTFHIVPQGSPQELPDKSEYLATMIEPPPPQAPGADAAALMLWEVIQ